MALHHPGATAEAKQVKKPIKKKNYLLPHMWGKYLMHYYNVHEALYKLMHFMALRSGVHALGWDQIGHIVTMIQSLKIVSSHIYIC